MTNEEKREALEACPFCGGEAKNDSYLSCDCCGKAYNGRIECKSCYAAISHRDTDVEAITAWNRRDHTTLIAKLRGMKWNAEEFDPSVKPYMYHRSLDRNHTIDDIIKMLEGE